MLADIQRTVYPEEVNHQLNIVAQVRESSPVKDQHSVNCGTTAAWFKLPKLLILYMNYLIQHFHSDYYHLRNRLSLHKFLNSIMQKKRKVNHTLTNTVTFICRQLKPRITITAVGVSTDTALFTTTVVQITAICVTYETVSAIEEITSIQIYQVVLYSPNGHDPLSISK